MRSLADAADPPFLPSPRSGTELRPAERRLLIGGVALAHVAALWGLLQVSAVQEAVRQVAPLVVDFITLEPAKPKPPPPPAPPPRVPVRKPLPRPAPPPVLATQPQPAPEPPAAFAVPAPAPQPQPVVEPAPAPSPAVVSASPPSPPTPPAPPAPQAPRVLPASSVAYLVPPPIEVPLASRRMGEEGTVLLRVRVGADGQPRAVTVEKSSGHARLDEQAVWAMKRARFKPQTENGVAIEWIVIAPLQYEIE
ncbi:MAG TPA: energy transducer TonB [Rubrivivax sp.]|nr:energy transducer TonB [Rubrivivax sp.]